MSAPRRGSAVWKAWADGKVVESRELDGRWKAEDPMLLSLRGKGPDDLPQNWRVRPDDIVEPHEIAQSLLEELSYRLSQTRCDCAHPACKACQDDAHSERVITWAKAALR